MHHWEETTADSLGLLKCIDLFCIGYTLRVAASGLFPMYKARPTNTHTLLDHGIEIVDKVLNDDIKIWFA